MIGFGTLAKLATGGMGPDELAAICEAAGMEIEVGEVQRADYRAAFGEAGASLTQSGARLVSINGRMKNGDEMRALIVLAPVTKLGDGEHQKRLDSTKL
jgi:hypothetical protein